MSDNGFTHLENLLMDMKESLEREIGGLGAEMRESANRIERAVKRHSSMIVAGTTAIAGLEKAIQDHAERLAKIERQLREEGEEGAK